MEKSKQLIGFRSNGIWTLNDLQSFIKSIEEIYNVFSAIKIKENQDRKKRESFEMMLKTYENYFHKYLNYPMCIEILELQRRILEDYLSGNIKNVPQFPFFQFSPLPIFEEERKFPSLTEIYFNISSYQSSEELINIYRIKMASPGGFSFEGIVDIIKEFREFIKDIWYRNEKERRYGQLEVIDKYLTIQNKYENSNFNLPPASSEDEIRKVLNNGVNNLKRLEKEKKLEDIGNNIEYLPE